jgi:hypothetical protein
MEMSCPLSASKGRSAAERRAVRQEKSKPLVLALKAWLEQQLARVSQARRAQVPVCSRRTNRARLMGHRAIRYVRVKPARGDGVPF